MFLSLSLRHNLLKIARILTINNTKYFSSWMGGGMLSSLLSICVNYLFYILNYPATYIATATAFATFVGFYCGNLLTYYWLHQGMASAARSSALKTLTVSNIKGALTSFVLRVVLHSTLLKLSIDPVLSYLLCYPLPSLIGTIVKFRHDVRGGLICKE